MIKNPQITFDQLVEAYDKTQFPKDRRPKKKEYLGQQRTILYDRWGVNSLDELPPKAFNKLNISGMVRLYLKKHGVDSSCKDAQKFFAIDGIDLHTELFRFARKAYLAKQSPDENQLKGPRAGKPVEEVKKRGRGPNKPKIANDFSIILEAKKFADAAGGLDKAKQLLEILAMVQSK
jgi:hypothetical protein